MPHPFRFGIVTAQADSQSSWVATARRAEELGYATLLMPDRLNIGSLSPFPALAVAAAATRELKVGSYVFCNEYRHPVLLVREAETLNLLSNGRFELGLGAGVDSGEFQQLGLPSVSVGTRVGHLEESLEIIKKLSSEETVSFTGKYYTLQNMKGSVQQPHIPLLVAGTGERMLKLAAREADIIAIGMKITKQGLDPNETPLGQKIAWIQEASGPRFEALELSQTIFDIMITDSPTPPPTQAGWLPVPKRLLSTEEAIADLQEQRSRYGISYLQVSEGQMENFAPIVTQLAGK